MSAVIATLQAWPWPLIWYAVLRAQLAIDEIDRREETREC